MGCVEHRKPPIGFDIESVKRQEEALTSLIMEECSTTQDRLDVLDRWLLCAEIQCYGFCFQEMIVGYRVLLRIFGDSVPSVYLEYALKLYLFTKDTAMPLRYLQEGVRKGYAGYPVSLLQGMLFLKDYAFDTALATFKEALVSCAGNARWSSVCHTFCAYTANMLEYTDEALTHYNEAIVAQPTNGVLYYERAVFYQQFGVQDRSYYTLALQDMETAIQYAPYFVLPYYYKAQLRLYTAQVTAHDDWIYALEEAITILNTGILHIGEDVDLVTLKDVLVALQQLYGTCTAGYTLPYSADMVHTGVPSNNDGEAPHTVLQAYITLCMQYPYTLASLLFLCDEAIAMADFLALRAVILLHQKEYQRLYTYVSTVPFPIVYEHLRMLLLKEACYALGMEDVYQSYIYQSYIAIRNERCFEQVSTQLALQCALGESLAHIEENEDATAWYMCAFSALCSTQSVLDEGTLAYIRTMEPQQFFTMVRAVMQARNVLFARALLRCIRTDEAFFYNVVYCAYCSREKNVFQELLRYFLTYFPSCIEGNILQQHLIMQQNILYTQCAI